MKSSQKVKIKYNGNSPDGDTLKASIAPSITGPKVTFPHRHLASIDTGVEIDITDGYSLRFSLVSQLTDRGLIASNAPGRFKKGKIVVTVINCGREIVEIKNGDPLINVWLEPELSFTWEKQ